MHPTRVTRNPRNANALGHCSLSSPSLCSLLGSLDSGWGITMLGCILVVDDNVMVRESYTELLRHRGYSVLQAGDGEQALDVVRTHAIDLAIIDVMMPTMGGLEFRQRLQDEAPQVETI